MGHDLAGAAVRILCFGSGAVGGSLARLLRQQGVQIWAGRRRAELIPPDLNPLKLDVVQGAGLDGLDDRFDAAVYCLTPDSRDDAGYAAAYVRGLENALRSIGGTPLIFVSSTAVYAQDDGSWVDEDSPTRPRNFRGRRMLEAESLLRPGDLAVRLGGIYGYGEGRSALLEEAAEGWIYPDQDPSPSRSRYGNRIHITDAVGLLGHLTLSRAGGAAERSVLLGVDSEPAPRIEIIRWLQRRLGVRPRRPAPEAALARLAAAPNKRCRNDRLIESGYTLQHPNFRSGYAGLIAERRARG